MSQGNIVIKGDSKCAIGILSLDKFHYEINRLREADPGYYPLCLNNEASEWLMNFGNMTHWWIMFNGNTNREKHEII